MGDVLQPRVEEVSDNQGYGDEADVQTKFLLLCGARWIRHRDRSAASELIAALESANADVASLAGTLLMKGCACA